jgi:hypothetical protein
MAEQIDAAIMRWHASSPNRTSFAGTVLIPPEFNSVARSGHCRDQEIVPTVGGETSALLLLKYSSGAGV